jgi:hypothetical protein
MFMCIRTHLISKKLVQLFMLSLLFMLAHGDNQLTLIFDRDADKLKEKEDKQKLWKQLLQLRAQVDRRRNALQARFLAQAKHLNSIAKMQEKSSELRLRMSVLGSLQMVLENLRHLTVGEDDVDQFYTQIEQALELVDLDFEKDDFNSCSTQPEIAVKTTQVELEIVREMITFFF